MKVLRSLVLLYCCILACNSWAFQACEIPLVIDFYNPSSNSIEVEWIDFNNNSLNFDIEIVVQGSNQTNSPTYTGIQGTNTLLTGLNPATSYELFIRAECPDGLSDWNGPYDFNTNVNQANNCNLNFFLSDDRCPIPDQFFFENELTGQLGENLFLESVHVSIEHNWPPDLKLQLVSPAGQRVDLISHLGINSQNLGDPSLPCEQTLSFSDRACEFIRDASFPIMGNYQPELPLEMFYDGSEGAGNWTLEICDRAEGDIGILKQFELIFSQGSCYPPGEIIVSKIGGTFVEIEWNSPSCDELEIIFGPVPFNPATASVLYVDCNDQFRRITGLQEDIDYEFYINTICQLVTFDNECTISFHTECANPSLDLNFDNLSLCDESCDDACDLDNDFWENIGNDDLEWLVNRDNTPTAFTGPDNDRQGNGNYIYVDAASSTCGDFLTAVIESACINIKSNNNACDLSFYYYMYGVDVGSIGLDISLDNGDSWTNLWMTTGNQGRFWQQTVVDLSPYNNQVGIFRILAETKDGNFGDIAIDEIKLYSSLIAQPLDIYYQDIDGDGYGDKDKPIQYCAMSPPFGFADNKDDCDDSNPLINPGINESPCNLIDDNCDEQIDEPDSNTLNYLGAEILSASCNGNKDADVEIQLEGGIPPYAYLWSDGSTNNPNNNIDPGIYQCTITDQGGCVLISNFINVEAEKELVFTVENITNSNCENSEDGSIDILIEGGTAPYQFGWSNASLSEDLTNISAGEYVVTITDSNNCLLVSDPIVIDHEIVLLSQTIINKSTSCNGTNDGELFIATTGGVGPYSYNWSNGLIGNPIENLSEGCYHYTVTDAQSCALAVDSICITSPDILDIRIDAIESNLCSSENEGIILTTPIGGTPPYSYFWSNGNNTDDIKSLENGNYNLTVNDSNGCSAVFNAIQISSPPDIQLNINQLQNETCRTGGDGIISVAASGGSGAFNYNWSNGVTNTPTIANLESGIYSVTVIDDFGCKKSLNNIEILEENINLPLNINLIEDIDCFGNNNGTINASTSQGQLPLDFNWSNGNQTVGNFFTDTISQLLAGTYNLTVTDGLGCTGESETIELTQPEMLSYTSSANNIGCLGQDLGSINLSINGGTTPHVVNWNNGLTGATISGLVPGDYMATITDDNECEVVTNTITIIELAGISANTTISNATSSTLGSVTFTPSNGAPPYHLNFDGVDYDPAESFTIIDLAPGMYEVIIIDAYNCTVFETITIDLIEAVTEVAFDKQFSLYPNPASELIQISGPDLLNKQLSIINAQGQSMELELTESNQQLSINTAQLPSGIYFLIIENKEASFIKKFVIL